MFEAGAVIQTGHSHARNTVSKVHPAPRWHLLPVHGTVYLDVIDLIAQRKLLGAFIQTAVSTQVVYSLPNPAVTT